MPPIDLDPSLLNLDASLREVVDRFAAEAAHQAAARHGRAAHAVGITLAGQLHLLESPPIPQHALLAPGRRLPVLLRHSNARGFSDDAIADGRGAALRLLRTADQLDESLLDLVLVTGQRFVARDAATFLRWASANSIERTALLRAHPGMLDALWQLIRLPDSYAQLTYYSQTTFQFIGLDDLPRLVRYQLHPPQARPEHGLLERGELRPPLDYVPRRSDDPRTPTFLQDELRARLAAGPIRYLLAVQLRPVPEAPAERDAVLDPTQPWPARDWPWLDVARVELDRVVDAEQAENLQFNIGTTPPQLGVIPARSAHDPASINHVRVFAYAASARARLVPSAPASLREALIDAARHLQPDVLDWQAGAEPREQIGSLFRHSALRRFPEALDQILQRLGDRGGYAADAVPSEFFERVARVAARFGDDPAALEDWVQLYRPVSLEVLRWRTLRTCGLYTSHAEFRANLLRTPGILAGQCSAAAAVRLDEATLLAVLRFASLEPQSNRVISSEYACSIKWDGTDWRVQATLETDYREESGDVDVLQRSLQRPLNVVEREFKLCVARAGGLLVDAFETMGSSRRVCVIGAGPAGLSVAHELERQGHVVTVLERAPDVAGKCASVEIDGHAFDLGGHLFGDHHRALVRLASEMGCQLEPATPSYEYDLDARLVREPRGGMFTAAQLQDYLRAKDTTFPEIQRAGLAGAADALSPPATTWLAQQGLQAVEATGVAYTASGYGFLTDPELASLYPVKFADMLGVLSHAGGRRWCIAGGMHQLWRRVAHGLRDVRLNSDVTRVERDVHGVHVTAGGQRLDFDDLILALPLERSLAFLDASEAERRVFSRIRYVGYHTTVATATGLPRNGFYLIRQHTQDASSQGHCVAFHHRYADSNVYTFYSYTAADGSASVQRLLREDIARMGGQLACVHAEVAWDYFPHFSSADLRDGWFEQLEALQGHARTYYVGSLLSFELVECTVRYAGELAQRFFATPAREVRPTTLSRTSAQVAASVAPPVPPSAPADGVSASRIREWLVSQLAARLGVPAAEIDPDLPVEAYPVTSLAAVSMIAELSQWLNWQVTPSVLVEYPTLSAIAEQLASEIPVLSDGPVTEAEPAPVPEPRSVLSRIRRVFR